MAAKDYNIVTGINRPYFARRLKDDTRISSDRREITDNEIIGLFDWYFNRWFEEHKDTLVIKDSAGNTLFEVSRPPSEDVEDTVK